MPLFFLLIGVLLVVTGFNNTLVGQKDANGKVGKPGLVDLVGDEIPGFLPWAASVVVLGSLGYVQSIKPIANMFLILLVLVLILTNGAFFDKFTSAIKVGASGGTSETIAKNDGLDLSSLSAGAASLDKTLSNFANLGNIVSSLNI